MIHSLWRCKYCNSSVEIIEQSADKVTYQNRCTKVTKQVHTGIFLLEFVEMDADDVLIETGGIGIPMREKHE